MHHTIVDHRNDHQGQDGRHKQAEDQRYGEAGKNRVIEDEKGARHRRQASQHFTQRQRGRGRAHDRAVERDTITHLLVDEIDQCMELRTMIPRMAQIIPIIEVAVVRRRRSAALRMPRQDADHRQRDRRHYDQRHQIRAKLRDHQQVDQQQADRVGNTHIAKGIVSDLPFTIPFDAVVIRIGVAGKAATVPDHPPPEVDRRSQTGHTRGYRYHPPCRR